MAQRFCKVNILDPRLSIDISTFFNIFLKKIVILHQNRFKITVFLFFFMGTFLFDIESKCLKAAYFTLGCKLNYAETSTIGRIFRSHGIVEAARGESADICVINTCSVTETADKKARTLIRRVARENPSAFIVVTGCYAQLKPSEVASIAGVDLVLGSKEKLHIMDYLGDLSKLGSPRVHAGDFSASDGFSPSCSRGDRTRFFLKVQDGCDYFCSYCTIPYARGRSRSGKIEEIVGQARQAAGEGGREIVLTGVNIGDFGKNTGESFADLLKALDRVEGIERFRISSIEPNLLTDEIIEWIAGESRAYMPHFHIPLQSGSDAVLKMMNRRYDTSLFAARINKIRSMIPDAFIGVDVIAGARGETPQEWERALEFIKALDITRLHVFPYSERPGTAALHLDYVVDKGERAARTQKLIEISNSKLEDFMRSNVGKVRPVLWESKIKNGFMSGFTDNYLRVKAPFDEKLINEVSMVRLTGLDPDSPETMIGVQDIS